MGAPVIRRAVSMTSRTESPRPVPMLSVTDGTETPIWHYNTYVPNQYVISGSNAAGFGPGVNPLYPDSKMKKDPGNQPSLTFCIRYESSDGNNVLYPCLDGINKGNW